MYGTLRRALAARNIAVDPTTYRATVEGRIEGVGQVIRITEIAVHYDFVVPRGARAEAERAVALHVRGCPAYQSVKDAIKMSWTADIKEAE